MSETWTIGELAELAADALRAAVPATNGRVRDLPGERLIRWYTTIGLVDPPLTRRGRVARYGQRHLLQLVAVKRLQAEGRSIAEIQVALAGATDRTLERISGLPRRFWTARPSADGPAADSHGEKRESDRPPARPVHGVRLTPGVVLLFDGASRPPTEEDLQAVMAAAQPLVEVLAERRLA